MCGIAGILRSDGKRVPAAWVKALDERIAHRGPDGAGRFRDQVGDDEPGGRVHHVVLVHRRLSILDHDGGTQPMVSERGRDDDEGLVAVVFNGCIYNHRALRATLEAAGHRFESDHSDTEVLVHGYREWGQDLVEHLEGMYAFAVWDRNARGLLLGRDWFGEKPLYVRRGFGRHAGNIAFASDARALASISPALRLGAVDETPTVWTQQYLQLGTNHAGRTVYGFGRRDAVTNEPPGIVGRLDDLLDDGAAPPDGDGPSDAELVELLDQAVARRLEADVPLGCFLSGGVDSSLIAYFARRHRSDLRTFCVRMPEPRYDESAIAAGIAEHLGTTHTTLDVAARPAEDLVTLVRRLGQPFGDSSLLPTFWVSRAAREHVTVALSGDGGDELFLGYDRYRAARLLVRGQRVLRMLPRGLFASAPPKSWRSKLGRLGGMARALPALGMLATECLFDPEAVAALTAAPLDDPPSVAPGPDPLQALRRADLVGYLPDDLLTKVDTASMAVALEVRAPFLDRDLVRTVLALPPAALMPGGRRKGRLRQIARAHLPRSVSDRPKMGFAVPIGEWFRRDYGSMRTLMLDHLRSRDPFGPVPVDRHAVKRLVDEHLDRRRDHGQRLFALLTLSIWVGHRRDEETARRADEERRRAGTPPERRTDKGRKRKVATRRRRSGEEPKG